jgi:hypothetical protein
MLDASLAKWASPETGYGFAALRAWNEQRALVPRQIFKNSRHLTAMFVRKLALACSLLPLVTSPTEAAAEPIPVRYVEGSVHGYLALRSLDGKLIAAGDLTQSVRNGLLTSRLTYRFKDGSIDDDTAVFTQNGYFRLVSDHRVQKGPAFPKPTDMMIKVKTGEVTVRYTDKGEEKVETTHMDLPDDLSNGILLDVVKNISAQAQETRISYVAATPKPRLVHLLVRSDGIERFRSAGRTNRAHRFKIHVDLGGIAGFIAPIIGKEPADSLAWVSADDVPAFIRSESPLSLEGPLFRTELVSPVWGKSATGSSPENSRSK